MGLSGEPPRHCTVPPYTQKGSDSWSRTCKEVCNKWRKQGMLQQRLRLRVCLGVNVLHAIPTSCNWAADWLHGDCAGPRG